MVATLGYHAWFGRKVQALELLMHAHALSSECSTQERVRGAHEHVVNNNNNNN